MKRILPLILLALALPAAASTTAWTYTPPPSGKTQGTLSWTDSSGFENIVNGAVLSGGLITIAQGTNRGTNDAGNENLKNLDLTVPVYAEDGTTQYEFSPYALGTASQGARIFTGRYLTNVVLHATCKAVGKYAFSQCKAIVKVTLNDGLEEICQDAFYQNTALESVEPFLPDSVKTIGATAFRECSSLSGTVVANGLETIGIRAFHSCSLLRGADFGASPLTTFSDYVFYNCPKLESVVLPNTLTVFGSSVFGNCTSLTNVTPLLPPRLTSLGGNDNSAFQNIPVYGDVVSPPTLASIPTRAFRTSNISSFTASKKGLKSIGQYAFFGTVNLTNVVLSADLESIVSGWLDSSGTTGVKQHVWFRNLPATIPSSLWSGTKKQNITIHLPWSQRDAWRAWVASGPSGHTFTFDGATKTLPDTIKGVGTWSSGVLQDVTWWKDLDAPTLIVVK